MTINIITMQKLIDNRFDIARYVDNYGILGKHTGLNCGYIGHLHYTCIMKKFGVELTSDEYQVFFEYQTRINDFVASIRTLDMVLVELILEYLYRNDVILTYNVLLLWSVPHFDSYYSRTAFDNKYRDNIEKYNGKITKLLDRKPITEFCLEIISSEQAYVYVHCLEFISGFLTGFCVDIAFHNSSSASFIKINCEHDKYADTPITITLYINLEYIVNMHIGINENKYVPQIIDALLYDVDMAREVMRSDYKLLYQHQMNNLLDSFSDKINPAIIELVRI